MLNVDNHCYIGFMKTLVTEYKTKALGHIPGLCTFIIFIDGTFELKNEIHRCIFSTLQFCFPNVIFHDLYPLSLNAFQLPTLSKSILTTWSLVSFGPKLPIME
jgi:hypothetical protein